MLGQVFKRKIAGFANESIGGGGVDQFKGFLVRQVVREQNRGEAVKRARWGISSVSLMGENNTGESYEHTEDGSEIFDAIG